MKGKKSDKNGEQFETTGKTADPHAPKPGDSPAVAAWRERMALDALQQRYKYRAATAECVKAQARNRGLQRLPVRGLVKVKGVAVLFALAHNLMRMIQLVPEWFGFLRDIVRTLTGNWREGHLFVLKQGAGDV
jgi:hypothetical protein